MWFDARAKLVEIAGETPATFATTATQAPAAPPVSQLSRVSQAPMAGTQLFVAKVASVATPPNWELIFDLLEERAAIREYDGGQSLAEAETGALTDLARSTGVEFEVLRIKWLETHNAPK